MGNALPSGAHRHKLVKDHTCGSRRKSQVILRQAGPDFILTLLAGWISEAQACDWVQHWEPFLVRCLLFKSSHKLRPFVATLIKTWNRSQDLWIDETRKLNGHIVRWVFRFCWATHFNWIALSEKVVPIGSILQLTTIINAKIETPQSPQDPWGAVYWKAQISDGKKEQNDSTKMLTNISMWRKSTPTLGRSLSLRETQLSGLSESYFKFWKMFVNGHFGSNVSQDGQESDKTGK